MSEKYKLNPEYIYSTQEDKVNIINIEDSDENIYTLTGVCAEIFPKIADGEEMSEVIKIVEGMDNAPEASEISDFLKKFVDDLSKINILQKD